MDYDYIEDLFLAGLAYSYAREQIPCEKIETVSLKFGEIFEGLIDKKYC